MKPRLNRTTFATIIFMVIGGYFLWTEHSAHIALAIPYLPFLLLLACPLLHVFMHGGHEHGQHDVGHGDREGHDDTRVETELEPISITVTGKSRIPKSGGHHE